MADDATKEMVARLQAGETLSAAEVPGADSDRFGGEVLGIRWGDFSLAQITATVEIDERHHQPYGIVHGGVWCAIIESMASFGAALHGLVLDKLVVGVSNSTDFLRSHRDGPIDGVATPVHVGRSQQIWQVVLTRAADGKPVARGQVRLQSVDPEQIGG